MSKKSGRGAVQKALDTIFSPMRALFAPEDSAFGLTSARDGGMEVVSKYAFGRVLDIGCGPGNRFVREWADIGIKFMWCINNLYIAKNND